MIVPGSNLLAIALGAIASQTITWEKFLSRSTNEAGNDVSVYDDPVPIKGSFQTVNRDSYQKLGLDFKENYSILYAVTPLTDLERDSSGDRFQWNGKYWQAKSNNDWQGQDGWNGLLCVEVLSQ
jgi:hypothetical protein